MLNSTRQKMTLIALDDEPLALVLIEKLATQIPDLRLLATFTDAAAAAGTAAAAACLMCIYKK